MAAGLLDLAFRTAVRPDDPEAVRRLAAATGFFSATEVTVAGELVEEALRRGAESGYRFLFAEGEEALAGYACYGPIPLTRSSFDLYWIVVRPELQHGGLGRRLLQAAEAAVAASGGTLLYAETAGRAQYAPTRAFYRRAGYRLAAELPDFYAPGDAKLIFEKRLAGR